MHETYSDVFEPVQGMPPKREHTIYHTIPLEHGTQPLFRPMYRLSQVETAEVQRQLTELLDKGLIVPSTIWCTRAIRAEKGRLSEDVHRFFEL